ncbi:MAG: hypothetical protein D3925_17975 [Candidatus Electrothrix sp. AR5]|nr:hypothetical protein [Candidatus Electrothrix sp. AR5]
MTAQARSERGADAGKARLNDLLQRNGINAILLTGDKGASETSAVIAEKASDKKAVIFTRNSNRRKK